MAPSWASGADIFFFFFFWRVFRRSLSVVSEYSSLSFKISLVCDIDIAVIELVAEKVCRPQMYK